MYDNRIVVYADPDADDCLAEAERAFKRGYPEVSGYDMKPEFQDENDRSKVILTLPGWFHDSLTDTSGT